MSTLATVLNFKFDLLIVALADFLEDVNEEVPVVEDGSEFELQKHLILLLTYLDIGYKIVLINSISRIASTSCANNTCVACGMGKETIYYFIALDIYRIVTIPVHFAMVIVVDLLD